MNQYEIERLTKLRDAVTNLENAVNDMDVKASLIYAEFLRVHPYLLNQIAKGLIQALHSRKDDPRISTALYMIKTFKV